MAAHTTFNHRLALRLGSALAFAAAISALSGYAKALNEVTVYGIATFDTSTTCPGDSHSVHTETAAAFRAPFDLWTLVGLWDVAHTANNTSARGTYWTDASRQMPCSGCTAQDTATYGVDSADVAYIHTHGGHGSTWSTLVMGSASYGCQVYTNSNLLFGNSDLEVAIVKACQSGDRNTWLNGGYDGMINATSQFSTWNAFHGDSSCGSHVTDYVSAYANTSGNDGLGENWLDLAYDYNGNNNDDCPTSLIFGETNKLNQFQYGGFMDRKSTGNKTAAAAMYWISGCNPYNGYTLP